MKYETKFNIAQVVCFKASDGGVRQGEIIGIEISKSVRTDTKRTFTKWDLDKLSGQCLKIHYEIAVQTGVTNEWVMEYIGQDRVANTFEEAWALR